jgi:hypothetical protein
VSAQQTADQEDSVFDIKNHREVGIRSVIDVHAWDQARWRGCGYMQPSFSHPPFMLLLFENAAAARKIFERWRERFGEEDVNEDIAISIIRNLPESNPHHYCVQISSKNPAVAAGQSRRPVVMTTRSQTMEPSNNTYLEMFLAGYQRSGAYFLIPAIGLSKSELFVDLAILKRSVSVKSADDVGEHDIEALALRLRGMKFAL